MSENRPILVVKPPLQDAGFAACILTVLNYARHCEREGLAPVVHIDGSCGTRFLDPEHGDNVWEQYFEPIGPCSSAELQRLLSDPGRAGAPEVRRADASLPSRIKAHPDSIYTWTFGHWRASPPQDLAAWFAEQRRKGRETVRRHVRIKPRVMEKVDRLHDRHMKGERVLGVHIRGTDLRYAPPVSPAEYFEPIERHLEEHPRSRIFLATDQAQYLDLIRKRYGNIVRSCDSLRSRTSTAPFNMEQGSPYAKGEDVLVDILLLSRCDFLIRGASNIPEMAIYFAENLESEDLSLSKHYAFGQDYLGRWSPQATRPAWEMIANTDLEQVSKHAASQSALQRLGYEARRAWAALARNRRQFRKSLRRFLGLQKS